MQMSRQQQAETHACEVRFNTHTRVQRVRQQDMKNAYDKSGHKKLPFMLKFVLYSSDLNVWQRVSITETLFTLDFDIKLAGILSPFTVFSGSKSTLITPYR
jgi:hypothetical protein